LSGPAIRIAIADDQPLFASGIRMLVEAQPDLRCVGIAHNGREIVALSARERPDVILMDLRMPVMNGLEATRSILQRGDILQRDESDPPRIIVLTTIQKDEAVFHALRAGAAAFLTKDVTPDVLLRTIRSSFDGDSASDPSATDDVIRQFVEPAPVVSLLDDLSAREREVFHLVAKGLSNSEISQAVFLSDATVKSHVRALLQKLNLRSRIQVVILAYENNLHGK
jgi:DNA-binding NarL/FixJ family response regulator